MRQIASHFLILFDVLRRGLPKRCSDLVSQGLRGNDLDRLPMSQKPPAQFTGVRNADVDHRGAFGPSILQPLIAGQWALLQMLAHALGHLQLNREPFVLMGVVEGANRVEVAVEIKAGQRRTGLAGCLR